MNSGRYAMAGTNYIVKLSDHDAYYLANTESNIRRLVQPGDPNYEAVATKYAELLRNNKRLKSASYSVQPNSDIMDDRPQGS